MTAPAKTAAALLIGNELLTGKIAEANLVELARTLRSLGVSLRRVVMVPDEMDTIARDVRALSETHDVVFTSGGVGPTHDDITIEAVAQAFGVKAKYRTLNRGMIKVGGWFNPLVGELYEMLYQNDSPYVFDSSKFAREFGFAGTSYAAGIKIAADSHRKS